MRNNPAQLRGRYNTWVPPVVDPYRGVPAMPYYPVPFYPPPVPHMMRGTPRGGRRGGRPNLQSPPPLPLPSLEPPPGVTLDPRALRSYVDLDAPEEETV